MKPSDQNPNLKVAIEKIDVIYNLENEINGTPILDKK